VVLQSGLDFSEFLSYGWFNDNHKQGTSNVLGYPLKVEARKTPDGRRGHFVEGYLLRGHGPADDIWKLAIALKKDGAPRQLGFSVEGKINDRGQKGDYPTVAKASVRNVAITAQPVNPFTGLEALTKALMAGSAVSAPSVRPGEGFPLRTESLDGYQALNTTNRTSRRKKRMSELEAVEYLLGKGCNTKVAQGIVALARTM